MHFLYFHFYFMIKTKIFKAKVKFIFVRYVLYYVIDTWTLTNKKIHKLIRKHGNFLTTMSRVCLTAWRPYTLCSPRGSQFSKGYFIYIKY
jgi:hypothetical protein